MRTSISFLIFLFLFISVDEATAQKKRKRPTKRPAKTETVSQDRATTADFKKIGFRVQAGASFTFENVSLGEVSPGFGYQGGVGFVYRFHPKFKMRFDALYSVRNYEQEFTSVNENKLVHITVPALFEYQPNKLSFFVGPHFNYLLKAQVASPNSDPFDVTDRNSRVLGGSRIGIGLDLMNSGTVFRIEGSLVADGDISSLNLGLVVIF